MAGNPDKLQTIYVSQLPWSVRDRHLQDYFKPAKGDITDCFVAYQGRRSRGFGYVTFSTADAATAALKLDGSTMPSAQEGGEGRAIAVVIAKPRDPEVEAAAKARVAARAEGKGKKEGTKEEGSSKPKPKEGAKKEGGKGAKKEGGKKDSAKKEGAKKDSAKKEGTKKEGGKGGRGAKKADSEAAGAAEAAPKKEKVKDPSQLQFNISPEQFEFLKAMATKYSFKGLNVVAKKLLAFAKDDEDNEVFAGAPARPETLKKLRLVLNEEERALVAKAQETHGYANRHVPLQALIKYVMPNEADPAEKASAEKMLDDIFKEK